MPLAMDGFNTFKNVICFGAPNVAAVHCIGYEDDEIV